MMLNLWAESGVDWWVMLVSTATAGPVGDEEARRLVSRLMLLLGPAVLAPVIILSLKPCFRWFLAESMDLFTTNRLPDDVVLTISNHLAFWNVITFVGLWCITFGSYWAGADAWVQYLLVIVGVGVAVYMTVRYVGEALSLRKYDACGAGLLAFAGGNLPLILLVPILLFLL
jgi:hypothetical protein